MTALSFQALRPDYAEKWAIVSKPGGMALLSALMEMDAEIKCTNGG